MDWGEIFGKLLGGGANIAIMSQWMKIEDRDTLKGTIQLARVQLGDPGLRGIIDQLDETIRTMQRTGQNCDRALRLRSVIAEVLRDRG